MTRAKVGIPMGKMMQVMMIVKIVDIKYYIEILMLMMNQNA